MFQPLGKHDIPRKAHRLLPSCFFFIWLPDDQFHSTPRETGTLNWQILRVAMSFPLHMGSEMQIPPSTYGHQLPAEFCFQIPSPSNWIPGNILQCGTEVLRFCCSPPVSCRRFWLSSSLSLQQHCTHIFSVDLSALTPQTTGVRHFSIVTQQIATYQHYVLTFPLFHLHLCADLQKLLSWKLQGLSISPNTQGAESPSQPRCTALGTRHPHPGVAKWLHQSGRTTPWESHQQTAARSPVSTDPIQPFQGTSNIVSTIILPQRFCLSRQGIYTTFQSLKICCLLPLMIKKFVSAGMFALNNPASTFLCLLAFPIS